MTPLQKRLQDARESLCPAIAMCSPTTERCRSTAASSWPLHHRLPDLWPAEFGALEFRPGLKCPDRPPVLDRDPSGDRQAGPAGGGGGAGPALGYRALFRPVRQHARRMHRDGGSARPQFRDRQTLRPWRPRHHQRLAVPDQIESRRGAGPECGRRQGKLRGDRKRQGPRLLPAGEPEFGSTLSGFLTGCPERRGIA